MLFSFTMKDKDFGELVPIFPKKFVADHLIKHLYPA